MALAFEQPAEENLSERDIFAEKGEQALAAIANRVNAVKERTTGFRKGLGNFAKRALGMSIVGAEKTAQAGAAGVQATVEGVKTAADATVSGVRAAGEFVANDYQQTAEHVRAAGEFVASDVSATLEDIRGLPGWAQERITNATAKAEEIGNGLQQKVDAGIGRLQQGYQDSRSWLQGQQEGLSSRITAFLNERSASFAEVDMRELEGQLAQLPDPAVLAGNKEDYLAQMAARYDAYVADVAKKRESISGLRAKIQRRINQLRGMQEAA